MSKIYILTKQKIGDAIRNYIGTYIENISFFTYRITKIEYRNDDSVIFWLEFVPKGSSAKDSEHTFIL